MLAHLWMTGRWLFAISSAAGGDDSSGTDWLTSAPDWLKTLYILGGSSGVGLLAVLGRNFLPNRGAHEASDAKRGRRAGARAESSVRNVEYYLRKAERELAEAKRINDGLESKIMAMTLELQEVKDELSRSREREAGAQQTIAALSSLLRDNRGDHHLPGRQPDAG